jgi:hypothetical protein
MTIISMATVGYGDISPRTPVGRIIGLVCVSWGVFFISVNVYVLTHTFSLNQSIKYFI